MRSKKKILVVEPSFIITSGLTKILAESQNFETLTSLNEMDFLKSRLASCKPDILIINPSLFVDSNNHNIKTIKNDFPKTALIGLVYQYIESSILKQFHGILDIRESKTTIGEKINDIYSSIIVDEQQDDNGYELSRRETDVLILMAKGLMYKEIADKLNISIHTVISHRKNITRKTNIKSVAGLAMYALMNNLIEESNP